MTTGLWRERDFMKLWTGQAVSELGSVVTRTALPIAAVLLLGATPLQMALLLTSASAAVLLFGLAAGAWIDRLRRRPIMIAADAVRAVALASVPAAAFAGVLRIEQLYAVVFVEAALGAAFDAAYRSYLPSLVGRARLVDGNSKLEMASAVAEIGGPGLAGGLVQVITAPLALLVDAFSFVVSAVSLALIRTPEPRVTPAAGRSSIGREIAGGLRFVWRERTLRAMTAGGVVNRFFGGFFVLYT
ncbi:MAG: MFS transporter, partial [Chloroflexota bacterium]|nr:MFS transporter [Chloroflexota bacterium]